MRNLQPLEQPPEVRTSLTGSGVPVNLRSCSALFDTSEPVWELRGTLLVRRERLVQVFESWKRKMRQARILLCAVLILGIVPALSINSISREQGQFQGLVQHKGESWPVASYVSTIRILGLGVLGERVKSLVTPKPVQKYRIGPNSYAD